jgi:hypothetical protein
VQAAARQSRNVEDHAMLSVQLFGTPQGRLNDQPQRPDLWAAYGLRRKFDCALDDLTDDFQ